MSRVLVLVLLVSHALGGMLLAAESRPHIVFILADDLGWGDVGFHGSDIKTPAIDRLAAAGARLESFYVQPVCSPTRAALLTGRYPIRYGLQVGVVRPWAQYGLPLNERTLPHALREVGYNTAICGKWHLGHFQPAYLPTRRGFDRQYGHYNGALDYFTHARDGGHDWHRDDRANYDEGYATHLIARESVQLIEQHDPQRPLFLYVPFNAVHSPLQAPAEYLERFAHFSGERQKYAAMLAAMDEGIGQIVAAIEKKGMRPNTLFIFSSDNGGPAPGRVTSNGPLRGAKGSVYEGGTRVAAFATWDGKIPAGNEVKEPLHIVDWYPTLLKLAGASLEQELPLDGRDAWPTIAHQKPSPHDVILLNVTPRNGAVRVGPWKLVVNGGLSDEQQADGKLDEANRQAVGKKKKKKAGPIVGPKPAVELFHLADDPYEKTNLAAQHPEKVTELRARLSSFGHQAVKPKSVPKDPDFQVPKVWGESP